MSENTSVFGRAEFGKAEFGEGDPSDPVYLVAKFANHLDLATFLTANPLITIHSIYAAHGIVLVYH